MAKYNMKRSTGGTGYLSPETSLIWNFLKGKWKIIREGMAEIIKHGFSMDYTIIETLLNNDMESVMG